MLLLILEITLIVYGIAALVSGKITLGSQREARGAVARIAGFIFLLPLPLTISGAFLVGFLLVLMRGPQAQQEAMIWGAVVEWGSFLGCGGLGMGIAFAGSVEVDSGYRRRRRDGYDEVQVLDDEPEWEEDERPRRRNLDVSRGAPTALIAGVLIGAVFLFGSAVAVGLYLLAWSATAGPAAAPPPPAPVPVPVAVLQPEDDPLPPPREPADGLAARQPNAPSPPAVKAERFELPGKVGAVAVGGDGGRYLLMHLPHAARLVVFDAGTASIIRQVPVVGNRLVLAACRDRAFVIEPTTGTLDRYALPDLRKEASVHLGMQVPAIGAAIGEGCVGGGTLCVIGVDFPRLGETAFINTARMERYRGLPLHPHGTFEVSDQARVFASYFGRDFACQQWRGGRVQTCTYPYRETSGIDHIQGELNGLGRCGLVATPLYTSRGTFHGPRLPGRNTDEVHVPARGPYGYSLEVNAARRSVTILDHRLFKRREIENIPGLDGAAGDLGRRLFFIPDAGLLAFLTAERDALILRHTRPMPDPKGGDG